MKTTLSARVVAARRFLSVAALRAVLGRVGFVDTLNADSSELRFVLDHMGKLAVSPLMQPLVHLAAVVGPITDAANITDGDRRDIALKAHLHDLSAQFVKKVRDLAFDVAKLLAFRLDELFPTVRSTLFAVDLRIELRFQLVLVVAESAKLSAVDREGVLAGEDGSEVFFAKVDSSNLVSGRSVYGLSVILRANNEAAGTLPDLNGFRLFARRPVDQNRILSTLCGQPENAVVSKRDALTFPTQDIVGFITTLRRIAFLAALMPRANGVVELISDCLGGLRRQYVVPLAVPLLHRCLTGPVALPIYGAPVPLADPVPQLRGGTGEALQLVGALNVEFAS